MIFAKKNIKWIIGIIVAMVIVSSISVYATSAYLATQVYYTRNDITMSVADALNDLYNKSTKYIGITDENAKRIIEYLNSSYSVNKSTLFNDKEYVTSIINTDDAVNYIINDNDTLNAAINSQFMMRNLLKSSKKNAVITKLNAKSYTNPQLTSSNGSDGGYCFGTDAYYGYGYQIWWGFNESKDYAYNGTGSFNLGYKFNDPIWCFKFSFKQRITTLEGVDYLVVQYSDDGNSWTSVTNTIRTNRPASDAENTTQEYIIDNAIGKHLYWRITGTGFGQNGGLTDLKFYGIK